MCTRMFCLLYIDKLTWSKLETGRLPSADEMKSMMQEVAGTKTLLFDAEPPVDEFSFDS